MRKITMTDISELVGVRNRKASVNRNQILVWDVPTRALHWLLVVCIGICWWTGIHDQLQYHQYSGYAILWIVLMRIYWGFAGSSTARFSDFVRGPKAVMDYARNLPHRNTPHGLGHNPIGAISVVAMLGFVLAVTIVGLFTVDVDGLYSGPLSSYVSFHEGRHLAHLHYRLFVDLLWLIVLHLVAIAFYYFYKRHNLVLPMITGARGSSKSAEQNVELRVVSLWRFVVGAVVISGLVWFISKGFSL